MNRGNRGSSIRILARLHLGVLVPPLLCVLALAARLYGLTYHSLWFDETMSTYWAARPAGEIWQVGLSLTQDKHPPLYYLLLHGWTGLFGGGDVAVRMLGVLLGALAVLPAYGIGRILGGRRTGFLAALLMAFNPFLVWYSQEARMFMPATTFLLVGLYGLLALGQVTGAQEKSYAGGRAGVRWAGGNRPTARWLGAWVTCVLGLSAALYTYLFSAFLLPVAGAWVLIIWLVERCRPGAGRRLAAMISALIAAGLLFLPLAHSAWSVSGAESTPGQAFAGMWPALGDLFRVYTLGWPVWPDPWPSIATAAAGLLLLAGLVLIPGRVGERRSTPPWLGGALLAIWLLVPVLIGGFLLARDRTVFAEARYFIFVVPALCLGWGRGLAALSTWPGWGRLPVVGRRVLGPSTGYLVVVPVVVVALLALRWDWAPQNRREAWREAAEYVAAHAGPNDAVLIQADYVHLAFDRYFRGPQPVFYPFTGPLSDPAQVEPALSGLADYDVVWVVQSHNQDLDPGNLATGWFGARFPMVTELFPPGIAIRGYAQHYRTPEVPQEAAAHNALADGSQGGGAVLEDLRLLACVPLPQRLPAHDDLFHAPSNWIHVTTYWAPGSGPHPDRVPSVRLVDAGGQVWGERLDRSNQALRLWPPSRWLPGEVVRADDDVNLNPVTPSGTYRLVVQVPGVPGEASCGNITITR